MREYTRFLKNESIKDIRHLSQENNQKAWKRTATENIKVHTDRKNHYTEKWQELLKKAETPTQKDYCTATLKAINDRTNDFIKYYKWELNVKREIGNFAYNFFDADEYDTIEEVREDFKIKIPKNFDYSERLVLKLIDELISDIADAFNEYKKTKHGGKKW